MGKLLKWPRQIKIRQRDVAFIDTMKAGKDFEEIYKLLEDIIIQLALAGLMTRRPFVSLIRSSHQIQDVLGAVRRLSRDQQARCPVLHLKQKGKR
jgi:hypothetical protein